MAFDFKKSLSKTAESLKKAAKETGGKIKEIDIKKMTDETVHTLKSTTENLKENAKNFNVEQAKTAAAEMARKSQDAIRQHLVNAKETDKKVKKVLKESPIHEELITTEDALKIIYLLIAADKSISDVETEKYDSIFKELDYNNKLNKEELISSCSVIERTNEDDYIDYILDGVQDALNHSKNSGKGTISKNLLLWDLLAVAYSDGEYSEEEKKILRTVNRRMEIDQTIILEMEAAVEAINAIYKEEELLKHSGKPYDEVVPLLEETKRRSEIIMQSVHELIED